MTEEDANAICTQEIRKRPEPNTTQYHAEYFFWLITCPGLFWSFSNVVVFSHHSTQEGEITKRKEKTETFLFTQKEKERILYFFFVPESRPPFFSLSFVSLSTTNHDIIPILSPSLPPPTHWLISSIKSLSSSLLYGENLFFYYSYINTHKYKLVIFFYFFFCVCLCDNRGDPFSEEKQKEHFLTQIYDRGKAKGSRPLLWLAGKFSFFQIISWLINRSRRGRA